MSSSGPRMAAKRTIPAAGAVTEMNMRTGRIFASVPLPSPRVVRKPFTHSDQTARSLPPRGPS